MRLRARNGALYNVSDVGEYRRIDAEARERASLRKAGLSGRQIRRLKKLERRLARRERTDRTVKAKGAVDAAAASAQ